MLHLDPNPNTYIDDVTGHVYRDQAATQPVTDPGLVSQARRNLQVANDLYAKVGGFQQQYNQAFTGQNDLNRALDRTIRGTGPSVAQTQLQQTQEQIARNQQSEAAGATGVNAALARYAAMQNTAQAQAQANQSGAILRAQEVNEAERAKAGVLANQAGEAGNMFTTAVGGANGAAANAGNDAGVQANIDEKRSEADKALAANLVNGLGNAAATYATASDPREKDDIKHVDGSQMEKLLKHLSGFTFEYKHPGTEGEHPGHRVGVMADDVKEGGPLGSNMVVNGKRLSLDPSNAIGTALAAIGYLSSQVKALQSKRGK